MIERTPSRSHSHESRDHIGLVFYNLEPTARELQAYIHKYHLERLRRRAESGTIETSEQGFLFPATFSEIPVSTSNSETYRSTTPKSEISTQEGEEVSSLLSEEEIEYTSSSDWPEGIPRDPTPEPQVTADTPKMAATSVIV